MKIFKGEMSLWKQLTNGKLMKAPGGLADTSTYKAGFFVAFDGFLAYFFVWNIDSMVTNFSGWLHNPRYWFVSDAPWNDLPANARRHHFYAYVFLIFCLFLALLIFYNVWSTRRRARKSAQGQWYDNPGLSKEDLSGKPRQRREDDAS